MPNLNNGLYAIVMCNIGIYLCVCVRVRARVCVRSYVDVILPVRIMLTLTAIVLEAFNVLTSVMYNSAAQRSHL